MPKPLSPATITVLKGLDTKKRLNKQEIAKLSGNNDDPKKVSGMIYRLEHQGLIEPVPGGYALTEEGRKVIHISAPEPDGVWKLVIFDIPESQRPVRNILRQRLQALGFKKWQNSIWASPFALDPSLEKEMKILASKYFIRLIKVAEINDLSDLQALFPGVGPKETKIPHKLTGPA